MDLLELLFSVYKSKNKGWRYKDFATTDEGSASDLIMKLKQCTFQEALSILNQDFNLQLVEEDTSHNFTIQLQKEWDASTILSIGFLMELVLPYLKN
ncbi:hypothetical protein [Aquimarina macrocephali]|uniref:hypothetical protein n=1 Tax=Aquimarina macrocephali TaxID=666563 RepID=UPI000464658F|nr:hypothetical protein [Aquimarina macrocephali]